MRENSAIKNIFAVCVTLICFIFCVRSGFASMTREAVDYMKQGLTGNGTDMSMEEIDSSYSQSIWKEQELVDLNGAMARTLHMQGYYSSMGMYITDDNRIVSASGQTSTDYEYRQITALKEFLDANGIHLLYVNEPTKYTDDSLFEKQFGVESYSNRNADLFLSRIREAGIPVIDLREEMKKDGKNIEDMFYRTDHHWTTRSALWAAAKIAEGLNDYCGYSIDLSIYDENSYVYKDWKKSWLGEQGRKVGATYVGYDDYTEIKPAFPTSYIFHKKDDSWAGTFDDFVDEKIFESRKKSWHYAYSQIDCTNLNADYGNVLLLGDSYEQVTDPFLSLSVHALDPVILRQRGNEFDLKEYILENGFDTVVISYAQFMIGAHDNESSANRNMFRFQKDIG